MRAIASAEARETMMLIGVVSCSGFCPAVNTSCHFNYNNR